VLSGEISGPSLPRSHHLARGIHQVNELSWAYVRAVFVSRMQKLLTLTLGALMVSPPAQRLRRATDLPTLEGGGVRTALVAHVFYVDLLPEILTCHAHLPTGSALFVTTVAENRAAIEAALAHVPARRVEVADNRGRDIAPFLMLLDDGAFDGFDAVLKLHTKKSPHLRDGDIRRKLLFATLAGSRRRVGRILTLFREPSTGMVGWRPSWRTGRFYWMNNRQRVDTLAEAASVQSSPTPNFFEGSMFWFRPAALARMKALGLEPDAFEPEEGQTDGALHHAVERIFAEIARADGFSTLDAGGNLLLPGDRGSTS